MKTEILKCLKHTQDYISGQELCQHFGVSRTAVWKAIHQLQEEGHEIEAVRNKGYRLLGSRDVLTEAELRSVLTTSWAGRTLVVLGSVDSTNNEVRRQADRGAAEGTVVIAERQEAGKGRRGRSWVSPEGAGIWMSLLLRPDFSPHHASMLTLVAAMAVADGIHAQTGMDCQIKWPNDLVVNGKKVCGILTEMATEEDTIRYVVIGIGVNVNTEEFPQELADTATSLYREAGKKLRRSALVNAILCAWERLYPVYKENLDMSGLMEEYNARLVNRNRQVRVITSAGGYTGVAKGIDRLGELLVEREDGSVEQVVSGEVSVRGIYGYV